MIASIAHWVLYQQEGLFHSGHLCFRGMLMLQTKSSLAITIRELRMDQGFLAWRKSQWDTYLPTFGYGEKREVSCSTIFGKHYPRKCYDNSEEHNWEFCEAEAQKPMVVQAGRGRGFPLKWRRACCVEGKGNRMLMNYTWREEVGVNFFWHHWIGYDLF